MANIKTARLDRRISILKETTTKNEYYEVISEWIEERSVWCSVKQQYFKDYMNTFGTSLQNTTNFIVRYETGKFISKDNRLAFEGKQYRIEDILEGSFDRDFTTIVALQMED